MQAKPASPAALSSPRQRLRVALITETYPPEINGVAMTLGRLVGGLQARGHPVQLIRPRQASEAKPTPTATLDQELRPGIAIPGYAGLKMGLPSKRRLIRLWTKQRPDIVHIATEGPLGWSALSAAGTLGIPVVSGFHTNFHNYSQHYGIGWLQSPIHAYLRAFHNRTQLTLAPTRGLCDSLTRSGYRNVEVLARGVDAGLFSPTKRDSELRRAWGVGPTGLVVIYVGRIAPEKNLGLLTRAFEAIEAVRPDARLILVGDGPALAALRRAQPRFLFQGARVGEDLARHYASADVFLFPSTTETFGNTLTEAMASGLACVSYDYAAAAEHVRHGDNGCKADLHDEASFINLAQRLADAPETIRRLGMRARETSLGLSWDGIHDQLENYYRGLLLGSAASNRSGPVM
jgi:glycosyltransferase involved in cell wall biosynthesis